MYHKMVEEAPVKMMFEYYKMWLEASPGKENRGFEKRGIAEVAGDGERWRQ